MPEVLTFQRNATLHDRAVNVAERTAKIAFSSEHPHLRKDKDGTEYWEILDHSSTDAVDLSLMRSGAVLNEHQPHQHIGSVLKISINTIERIGRAKIKFLDDEPSDDVFRAVSNGDRPHISVGYIHLSYKTRGHDKDGVEIRVFRWRPFEISSVALPVDYGVGVGRSLEMPDSEPTQQQSPTPTLTPIMEPTTTTTNQPAAQSQATIEPSGNAQTRSSGGQGSQLNVYTPSDADKAAFKNAERVRQQEIRANGIKFGQQEAAEKAIDDDVSSDQFLRTVTQSWEGPDTSLTKDQMKNLGRGIAENTKEHKEARQFDILKAIQDIRETGDLQGREAELSDEAAGKLGQRRSRREIYFPAEMGGFHFNRAQEAADLAEGGYLKEDQKGPLIEKLDAMLVAGRLNATRMVGLVGDVPMPRVDSNPTAYWLGEVEAVTESSVGLGQIVLRPHRLATQTVISDQLLMQTSGTARNVVERTMLTSEALALDIAYFDGEGANNEPIGLTKHTGIGSMSFAGTPTRADYIDLWSQLAIDNAAPGEVSFITSSASIAAAMKVATDSGSGSFVIESAPNGGFMAIGRPVHEMNQTLDIANQVICVYAPNTFIATWGTRKVVVDEVTAAGTAQIKLTSSSWHDTHAAHVQSIAASTDDGVS